MKSTVSTICGIFLLFAMGVSVSSSASSGSYSGCAAMLGTKDPEKLRKICGSKAENSKKGCRLKITDFRSSRLRDR